jgi:glycerol-3-phosphate dehydrogenase (NAD(P)+)
MKTTILGCGRWGSFLAWYADRLGHKTKLWGRENSKNLAQLKEFRKNEYVYISESIQLCDSLDIAVAEADYLIISIGSQELRSLCGELNKYDLSRTTIIQAMKGNEKNSARDLPKLLTRNKQKSGVAIGSDRGMSRSLSIIFQTVCLSVLRM